jgi:hypothetical protein
MGELRNAQDIFTADFHGGSSFHLSTEIPSGKRDKPPHTDQFGGGKSALAIAAHERRVVVVEFLGDVAQLGLRGDEFHFADQRAAPGFVDTGTELRGEAFDLPLPRLCVR